ncbi:MAG TPA: M28 family metallopeptidase [Terriglobales bacterium]
MFLKGRLLALSLLTLSLSQAQQSSLYPPQEVLARIRPESIRAQMEFLSDDLLEGRATGSRGFLLAAKYVAAQFKEMGLQPAGTNGSYFQNLRFRSIQLQSDHSSVVLKRDGAEERLVIAQDYLAEGNPLHEDAQVEAPVVFVGYGVTAPEEHYDDYAGVDVKGKIVAMIYGAPANFPVAEAAHYSSRVNKAKNAAARGAVGIISIWAGSREKKSPFSRLVRSYGHLRMRWLDDNGNPGESQPEIRATVGLSKTAAEKMFAGAQKSFSDALAYTESGKPQAFPLAVTVSIHLVSKFTEVESPNIAALLPGSDPQLRNEYVLFTAHGDHLGIGNPVNGDSIYNGAIDNASGTAAVLEIARALASLPTPPRRSFLFLVVTGEEEGLQGSDAYAHHPTVPISQIVADVNMDEIGMFYDFRDFVPQGADHSSIGAVVADVARHMDLEISPDPEPEEVFFVRSDQYSFVKQGIPAVAVDSGHKAVDPKLDGRRITYDWEQTYYHSPQDDMNQPYLDLNAAAKCARLNLAIAYEIAQQTERPRWNPGDFFERFARQSVIPSASNNNPPAVPAP